MLRNLHCRHPARGSSQFGFGDHRAGAVSLHFLGTSASTISEAHDGILSLHGEERAAGSISSQSTIGEMPLMSAARPTKMIRPRQHTADAKVAAAPARSAGEAWMLSALCPHRSLSGEMVDNSRLHAKWRGHVAVDAPRSAGNPTRCQGLRASAFRSVENSSVAQ